MSDRSALDAFDAIPKVELHCHVEGTVRPPNSNVMIANRYPSLAQHPFRRMRESGLLVTLNTDDPAMTDLDLGKEYRTVAAAQGMAFAEMCDVALDGVEASWLDDGERRTLRARFQGEIAAIQSFA